MYDKKLRDPENGQSYIIHIEHEDDLQFNCVYNSDLSAFHYRNPIEEDIKTIKLNKCSFWIPQWGIRDIILQNRKEVHQYDDEDNMAYNYKVNCLRIIDLYK